ncbi:MAG: O-methyltransferase [Bacteroidales bacterium]|nr:O-methyltransferase [Bacteroidales bacterium]
MEDKREKQIHPFIDRRIEDYCNKHHSNCNEILSELERQTHLCFVKPHMVSGAWQGELLMMLCRILRPERILEIGTFSGYATTCFALATDDDCKIDTIEALEEYKPFLIRNFTKNNIIHKINLHFGQGLDVVKEFPDNTFDLIFLDAEKIHYPDYYPIVVNKLRQGGLLLADNILWYGKTALEYLSDKDTVAIRRFNDLVTEDERVENIIIPVRDGIMVARRR